jgi:AAA domain
MSRERLLTQSVKPPNKPPTALALKRGRAAWQLPKPRDWLVEGVIPQGMLGAISAYGSSLKSWILLDLALAVASGRPALGRFPTGKPSPVLYLDYENDETETGRRLTGLSPPLDLFDLCCFPETFLPLRRLRETSSRLPLPTL